MKAIIPYTPGLTTSENRLKFISFVMLGILGTFFVILLFVPALSISLVTKSGKALASYSRTMIGTTISQGGKALAFAGDTIKDVSSGGVMAISTMTTKTVMAIEYLTDLLRHIPELVGGLAKNANSSLEDLMKMMSAASRSLVSTLGRITKQTQEFITSMVKRSISFFHSSTEALSKMVDDVFVPTLRRMMSIPSEMAATIASVSKSYIPYIVEAFKMIMTISVKGTMKDIELTLVSLNIAQFTKVVTQFLGTLTGGNTVDTFMFAIKVYLGQTVVNFSKSILFCGAVTLLIEFFLNKVPLIPGFIRECQTEAVQLGIAWLTNTRVCGTKPKGKVAARAALCFVEQIGDFTLVPAFEFEFGPLGVLKKIGNLPYIPDPLDFVIDRFLDKLDGLPSLTIGWQDISFSSLLRGASSIISSVLEVAGVFAFSATQGIQMSFSGNIGPSSALSIHFSIMRVMVKLIEKIVPLLWEQFRKLSDKILRLIKRWDVCTPRFCVNLVFTKICSPRLCASSIIGSMSSITSWIMSQALTTVKKLMNVSVFVSKIIGVPGPSDATLDRELDKALQNLTIKLPFYVRLD